MRSTFDPDTRSVLQSGFVHNRWRHFFLCTEAGTHGRTGYMWMSTCLCFLAIYLRESQFMTEFACCNLPACLDSRPRRPNRPSSQMKRYLSYERLQRISRPNPTHIFVV